MYKILIIDDDSTMRLVLKKTLEKVGYEVTVTNNGAEGLTEAKKIHPALILCDWMMPIMDGLEVCKQIKADDDLSAAFFILLTARGEVEDKIKGLDTGADDFVSKPIDLNELKARVRAGIRLYELNHALRNQKQVLEELNQKLQRELDEAAEYVRSLLPSPLTGKVKTDALFNPSAQLGGDCFDYYWLDQDNLAIYLLDVSGHGVGAALLSVSVLNVLRSQSLPQTNFYQPSEVLNALNRNFQMLNGDKYFTIWYGVYNLSKRQITYSNAGHPPALMISGNSSEDLLTNQLGCPSIPIGILPEGEFIDEHFALQPSSIMYIFSDGVYEIQLSSGKIWGLQAFSNLLAMNHHCQLTVVMNEIRNLTGARTFDDDFSLLKIQFE
jgi:phosphoserine phosphatase RsbU/P